MNVKRIKFIMFIFVIGMVTDMGWADTFKNKETGEVFYGFMTQKSTGSKTLIYNSDKKELTTINLSEYEIVYDSNGRKNNVVVVPVTKSEVLLSQVVSETIAKAIIDASNKGPQAIIVQIDNPGGRGDYMKIITSAITQTNNCPVLAYISGSQYGGAFSTAAMVALACDKVFISPTASMGAIGPIVGSAVTDEDFSNYIATYCSDSLASYSIYATALAHEHNRPALLVRALIDKRLSVEEVKNNIGDTLDYVQRDERQPTQTRVRTLAEGIDDSASYESTSQAQIVSAVLNLPPTDAIKVGLADKMVDSLSDILAEMNLQQAQLTNAGGIENTIKKYSAARRNIAQSLSRIQWLEDRSALLEEQLTEIERQLRTGTVTREVSRRQNSAYRRSNTSLPENYDRYYYDPGINSTGRVVTQGDQYTTRSRNRDDRTAAHETETIVTQEPTASVEQVQRELIAVLNDLIVEYRQVMSQAKRWPGGLPPEIPYQTLEQNRNSAGALRDYLLRQPVYGQPGIQQQAPATPSGSRRNRY
ncbi:MAG: hypothetical protein ISS71_06320 [Phycisphaerae bacterium]|nr:hypothetical protein [Phycisphaerae bacterium]